ncbi:MAG: NHLP leader peptide family RiPP precursor [Nostoc sp. LLA-1]|nr:NHLP leader peptide family RiPP precursor [Cyanocohniella sp. LLY]
MHEELKQIISQSMNTRFEFEQKLIQRAWEDEAFKQELISNPKAVFARESGQEIPGNIEVEVIQETANKVYLVLPHNPTPAVSEGELSEEALETVAGGSISRWTWKCRASIVGWTKKCTASGNNLV